MHLSYQDRSCEDGSSVYALAHCIDNNVCAVNLSTERSSARHKCLVQASKKGKGGQKPALDEIDP